MAADLEMWTALAILGKHGNARAGTRQARPGTRASAAAATMGNTNTSWRASGRGAEELQGTVDCKHPVELPARATRTQDAVRTKVHIQHSGVITRIGMPRTDSKEGIMIYLSNMLINASETESQGSIYLCLHSSSAGMHEAHNRSSLIRTVECWCRQSDKLTRGFSPLLVSKLKFLSISTRVTCTKESDFVAE
jgi:hypothetical protein